MDIRLACLGLQCIQESTTNALDLETSMVQKIQASEIGSLVGQLWAFLANEPADTITSDA